jgi:hypothetical protein
MFTLDQVVPWGRSYEEYTAMFLLTGTDLAGRILGCGDGPASFNAEASRRGSAVVSCDPLYAFSTAEIEARIDATVTFRKDVAGRRLFRPPGERVTSPWLLCHLAVH